MKKNRKLFCIILLMLCLILILSATINVNAADGGFKVGKDAFSTTVSSKANDMARNSAVMAITLVRIVGVTIAVVMLFVIAIKYMVSSAGDRADIKKHAFVYVVGAFVLFAATGILGLISDLAQNISE